MRQPCKGRIIVLFKTETVITLPYLALFQKIFKKFNVKC